MSTATVEATPATPEVESVVVPESRDWAAEITALITSGDKPSDLYARGEAASTELQHASSGLIPWFALAYDIHVAKGMTADEFAAATGSDKNYLLRLRNAHEMFTAHAAAGLALTPIEAMKVANSVKNRAAVEAVVTAVEAGEDPLGVKRGIGVRPNSGAANSRKGKGTKDNTPKDPNLTVEPKNYGHIMEVILARVTEASKDQQARMLAAAREIATTLETLGVEAASHE